MCFCKKDRISLQELMCRCYHQVQISERRKDDIFMPDGFGSAFLFAYKNCIFLISAEHVLSPSNFYFKLDPNKEYIGGIYTYKNVKTPDGQFSPDMVNFFIDKGDYTKYFEWDEIKEKWITRRADMFYYPISNNPYFKGKEFVTQGQIDEKGNSIYGGLPKIIINERSISEPNATHTYSIYGLVQNDIQQCQIIGKSIYHHGLKFEEQKSKGTSYFFSVASQDELIDKHLYWEGLSGTAVFDEQTGQVVGMAIMYDEDELTLEVFPMKHICAILDGYIKSREVSAEKFMIKP